METQVSNISLSMWNQQKKKAGGWDTPGLPEHGTPSDRQVYALGYMHPSKGEEQRSQCSIVFSSATSRP